MCTIGRKTCTIGRKTCIVGRKFWFSGSGGCAIADVVGRERERAEERLRTCAVEAVSFDDTLGELHKVFGKGLNEDQTIPVCLE